MAASCGHPISGVPLHNPRCQPHARIWRDVLGLIPQVQRRACRACGPWSREDTAEMNPRPGGGTGRRVRLKSAISGSSSLPLGTTIFYTRSSIGRATVSKTVGCWFDSNRVCQTPFCRHSSAGSSTCLVSRGSRVRCLLSAPSLPCPVSSADRAPAF